MFVGHALLAFALVALLGERLGWDRRVVAAVAVLAGLFGALPDVDVVYGVAGLLDGTVAPEAFWAAGNQVHRGLTHSIPVALVTAGAAGLLARRDAWSLPGVGLLAALVAMATVVSGALAGLIATVFVAGASVLALAARRYGVSPRIVAGAALVGLVSHPFGDLFTGTPPALLYPFDAALVADRVVLSADPTLHLIAAFAVELAAVWLAFVAACRLTGRRPADLVGRRAALGALYGPAALVLPAPTLGVSYHFVYSVLGVSGIAFAPTQVRRPSAVRSVSRTWVWRAAGTALGTVTMALVAYTVVYLVV